MANEKRLMIDAELAKRATYEEIFWSESEQAVVRNFLARLPKVDAVEVVRDMWIPVTERLPKEFVSVLVCIPSENPLPMVKEAYLANGCWATKMAIFPFEDITHWMEMPEPPKGE